jgi:hypothetical protein
MSAFSECIDCSIPHQAGEMTDKDQLAADSV